MALELRDKVLLGSAALLALGVMSGGYLLGDGLKRAKAADRSVTVRGLSEKDVEVKVEDNLLSISSVKSEEKEEKKDGYILKERRERNFSRSFMLPKDADREKIEAVFKNGVLSLIIAKSPKSLPKTIQVKSK